MSESPVQPLNDAERLCRTLRGMPAGEVKVMLVDALTDPQLIRVLTAVDEQAPGVFRHLWDRMEASKRKPPPRR